MSNHYHLVLHVDKKQAIPLSEQEIIKPPPSFRLIWPVLTLDCRFPAQHSLYWFCLPFFVGLAEQVGLRMLLRYFVLLLAVCFVRMRLK